MITEETLRERAKGPAPQPSGTPRYMRWWRARTALGIPVKTEYSQARRLEQRREYLRIKKQEQRERDRKANVPRETSALT